jgi:hypothetical protein
MAHSAVALRNSSRHSISTLRYRLISGPVDLAPLKVIESREIDRAEFHITFYVLGASHAVTIERGGRTITELLTCSPPLKATGIIAEARVESGTTINEIVHGITVRSKCRTFELYSGWTVPEQFNSDQSLRVGFPYDGENTAETAIRWYVNGQRLLVETLHTYPEEGFGVRSKTEFETNNASS